MATGIRKGRTGNGNNTFFEVAILQAGVCRPNPATGLIFPPIPEVLTLAVDANVGDTILQSSTPLTSLVSGGNGIAAGTVFIINPDTAEEQYVEVAANVPPSDTSTVLPISIPLVSGIEKTILSGTVIAVPGLQRLLGGRDASESNSTNSVSTNVFENENSYETTEIISQSASVSWEGLLLEEDPAYLTLFNYSRTQTATGADLYVRTEKPRPIVFGGATVGTERRGVVTVESLEFGIPIDNFVTVSFTANFRGEPEYTRWKSPLFQAA